MKNFLLSSADPTKIALTVKSITGFLISMATVWLTVKGMPQEVQNVTDGLNMLADQVIILIGLVSQAIFGALAVWGLLRKLFYSLSKPTA
jgi:hypothetical protein